MKQSIILVLATLVMSWLTACGPAALEEKRSQVEEQRRQRQELASPFLVPGRPTFIRKASVLPRE